MLITHAIKNNPEKTAEEKLLLILEQGLIPGWTIRSHDGVSDPRFIYFELFPRLESIDNGWGIHSLVLDNSWVRTHNSQFEDRSDDDSKDDIEPFLKQLGIIRPEPLSPGPSHYDDIQGYQIVSRGPVPVAAFESLVIKSAGAYRFQERVGRTKVKSLVPSLRVYEVDPRKGTSREL